MYTLAGLLTIAGALVGLLDALSPQVHYACTSNEKTADQKGGRFIHPEARDKRETTR